MRTLNKKYYLLLITFYILICTIITCKKDSHAPENPYDKVDYTGNTIPSTPPDPNSFVGIHKNILSVKCAIPSCHDGSFEPDYRTVQSAYSTLVYHPVKKNSPDSAFKYRVVPNDTAKSWLVERLTTDDANLGRMPLYSSQLSQSELNNIYTWILNGAKDMNGNIPPAPNEMPNLLGYIAVDSTFFPSGGTTGRMDTIRKDNISYNPFLVQPNSDVTVIFLLSDDSTNVQNLQINQMKVSLDRDDFSNAKIYNATYFLAGTFQIWMVTLHTTTYFPSGSTVYFRYYVNDGQHINNTEFPKDESLFYYKTFFAYYIQ